MIKASAPGSIMLLGEHAVLYGHRSLVLAVNKRMFVTLTPRSDNTITISSALAECQGSISELPQHQKLDFVCQAIAQFDYQQGFDLKVESQFSHTIGLASSAAVTVATLAALRCFCGEPDATLDRESLLKQSVGVIRSVQGRGSGSDAAACVYGGAVAYQAQQISAHACQFSAPFSLYYLGYKTPTPVVLEMVANWREQSPEAFDTLYAAMGQTVEEALGACQSNNIELLAACMTRYQGYMHALGVADSATLNALSQLIASDHCLAAKISGSGLGDCVIALGQNLPDLSYENIEVQATAQGVIVEQS